MKIKWLTAEKLLPTVIKKIQNANIVLDIGCGIMPQGYIKPMVHICCEPYKQYINKLQKKIKNEYDREYVIIELSWGDSTKIFPEKSVDTVFLVDVIEHLNKNEAKKLLEKTEKIARNQIIIFTPLGFLPQSHLDGKDAWGLKGGKWQEHVSGWEPTDFDKTWDIFACKKYHISDNKGVKYQNPKGAFWAIKTIKPLSDSKHEKKRSLIRQVNNVLMNIDNTEKIQEISKLIAVSSNLNQKTFIQLNIFVFKLLVRISNLLKNKRKLFNEKNQ